MAVSVARLTVAVSTPGGLAQEALDPVDARRAGHPLDGQGQLGGRSVIHTPQEYITGLVCQTPLMSDRAAIRTSIPGPWGPLQVAATARGIVAVEWLTTEAAFEAALARRLRAPVEAATGATAADPRRTHLAAATAALEALLAGRAGAQALRFDLADRPAWDRRVLEAVAAIPWGPDRELRRDRAADRVPARRACRRWRRRPQPGQPADPVSSRDRRRRHDRRLRRRRVGQPGGSTGHEARAPASRRGHGRACGRIDSARPLPRGRSVEVR